MSLGSLRVSLGLDAAEFVQGMSKAEYQAKRFSQNLEKDLGAAINFTKGAFGLLASAVGGVGLTQFVRNQVDAIDSLNDMADATGSTVEKISALRDIAQRTGTTVESADSILVKFNASLKDGGDPNTGPAAVLKRLGLNAAELRKQDPAEALRQTAMAFTHFANDGDKARGVQELFGKSVREAAPFLKDLAEAGQLNASVTKAQAQEAEIFNKQLFSLQTNVSMTARKIVGDMLPALNAMAENMRQMFGGPKSSETRWTEFETLRRQRDELKALEGKGFTFKGFFGSEEERAKELASVERQLEQARAAFGRRPANEGGGSLASGSLPGLGGIPEKPKGAASTAKSVSDAERYLESLRSQLVTTQQLSEVEKVLAETQGGRLAKATTGQVEQAKGLAIQIDAVNMFADSMKASEEAGRNWLKVQMDGIEVSKKARESVEAENQALIDEIAVITGGETARRAIEQARISSAIATREQAKALRELEGASEIELVNLDREIEKLRERGVLLGQRNTATDQADVFRKQQDESERQINAAKAPFEDQFTAFLDGTKSAKEALSDFTKSYLHNVNQMMATSLSDAIFGKRGADGKMQSGWLDQFLGGMSGSSGSGQTAGASGGGSWAATAGTWFAGLFGGGKAIGGPTMPNTLYQVGERRPEVFNDGSKQYLLTGNKRGYVDPNPRMGGGRTIAPTINISVAGNTSRGTATQIGAEVARQIAVVSARNN